jgi:hypothetical protein
VFDPGLGNPGRLFGQSLWVQFLRHAAGHSPNGMSSQKPRKNNQREKTSRAGCRTYSRRRPGVKEKQAQKLPKMRDLARFGPAGRGIRSMKPTGSMVVDP